MCCKLTHSHTTAVGGHPDDHVLLCWDHEAINKSGPVSWKFFRAKPSKILRRAIHYVVRYSATLSFVIRIFILNSGINRKQRPAVGKVAALSANGTVQPATKPPNRAWGCVKFDSYSFEVIEGGDEQELEEKGCILRNGGISTSVSRGSISTLRITRGKYLTQHSNVYRRFILLR